MNWPGTKPSRSAPRFLRADSSCPQFQAGGGVGNPQHPCFVLGTPLCLGFSTPSPANLSPMISSRAHANLPCTVIRLAPGPVFVFGISNRARQSHRGFPVGRSNKQSGGVGKPAPNVAQGRQAPGRLPLLQLHPSRHPFSGPEGHATSLSHEEVTARAEAHHPE